MATESTAIVNLIDLVRNREVPKNADDDLLFGGKARFDATAMPAQAAPVMLPAPAPMIAGPTSKVRPAYDHVRLSQMRLADTQAIRAAGPSPLVKKVVASGCAFVAVMVVLAVYLAKRDSSPSAALAESTPKPTVAVVTPPPVAPVVTPIETKVETTVTPIETAPAAEQEPANKLSADLTLQPTVPAGPVVTPEESPVVAAAVAPVAKVAKKSVRKSALRAAKRAKAQKRETRVAIAEPVKKNVKLGGKGQLAIANTSGGDIWVDGRKPTSSRLTLEPGKHNITMFDKKTRKAKTFQVEVKPNQTTTVRR